MGRFERSERGGGQPDPQEALRSAREAVTRERAREQDVVGGREPRDDREDKLEDVEKAMREHDEHDERERDG
jgi:hypothetical protein